LYFWVVFLDCFHFSNALAICERSLYKYFLVYSSQMGYCMYVRACIYQCMYQVATTSLSTVHCQEKKPDGT
jgi:hypothetical protein